MLAFSYEGCCKEKVKSTSDSCGSLSKEGGERCRTSLLAFDCSLGHEGSENEGKSCEDTRRGY